MRRLAKLVSSDISFTIQKTAKVAMEGKYDEEKITRKAGSSSTKRLRHVT